MKMKLFFTGFFVGFVAAPTAVMFAVLLLKWSIGADDDPVDKPLDRQATE